VELKASEKDAKIKRMITLDAYGKNIGIKVITGHRHHTRIVNYVS